MNCKKYIAGFLVAVNLLAACKKTDYKDVSFVTSATTATKLAALFTITQDNSGLVTITPNGEGAVNFDVYFGDGTATPAKVAAGSSVQHTYKEGTYDVKLVAKNIAGKTTETTQKLTVSFRAPENLDVQANIDATNNYKVNVSAKATYETFFTVTFGDVTNEIPTSFMEGETVSHTYAATGTYTVKVVALSGGAATTTFTKQVTIVDPVLLPLTFESATLKYNFVNFDGGNTTIVANPQANGINTSGKVAKMVKGAGQPWGGSFITLNSNIDFSANKIFRMKVYSPRVGAKVLLKVENTANTAQNFEKEVATTVANKWEDLVFDYSQINTSNSYNNIVIIFDLGTVGDGSANYTFLFDDIRLTNSVPMAQIDLPVSFDDAGVNYSVIDFGNNATEDAVDPLNSANKVKKTTKPNGAETWAGTTIGTTAGFASRIPFAANATKMTVRVYSPAAGLTVLLKAEDAADNTKSVETSTTTKTANAWETLEFDFSKNSAGTAALNLSTVYKKLSIFFDFGTAGNGKVFYWDDVAFATPSNNNALALPLDFQSSTLTYDFVNFDGGNVSVVNNPSATGINTSSKVGKMVKGAGQPWGGSWIALANPMDFSTKKIMKMKVYSPRVGAKVLLKVENLTDGTVSFEKETATTKANAWEEISFDYSAINTSKSYQKVVLIFDLGTVGDGSANFTYYFDDINVY